MADIAKQIMDYLGFRAGKDTSVHIRGKKYNAMLKDVAAMVDGTYKKEEDAFKVAQKEAVAKIVEREKARQKALEPEVKKKAEAKAEAKKKKAQPNPKQMAEEAREANKSKIKKVVVRKAKKAKKK